MIYSHSRIESFKQCPLKFKYNYIEKPDIIKKNSIEAFMGSQVHSTLEKLYKDLKFKKLDSLEELITYYLDLWDKNYNEELIEIVKKEFTKENYKELGKQYITNYYNKYKPFDQGKTLGIELRVNVKLYDSKTMKTYNLVGYIDRLTIVGEDHIEIHDYKTNNRAKTQSQLDEDKQLALYSIAIKEMYPFVKKIDLVWHFLAPCVEMRSTRTDLELENLKKEIIESIEEIERSIKENYFPPKESILCDWCPFKSICPVKSHEVKTKELEKEKFYEEEGVKLVDEYSKLIEEKKKFNNDIDKKIDDLKKALISYSQKNNVEKLVGSEKKLLIKSDDSVKLPLKGTASREELENLIKENKLWDELSTLSSTEFSYFLKSNMFNKEFIDKLNKFIKIERNYHMYLSKK